MIHKAINYILENDSDFNTAVGGNIHPIVPRKTDALPLCTYELNNANANYDKDTATYNIVDQNIIKITVYDYEFDDVIDLAEKARIAMESQSQPSTINTVDVRSIDMQSMNDGFNINIGPNGAYFIELDFEIWATP